MYKILKDYEQTLIKVDDLLGTQATTNIQLYNVGKKLFQDRFITCSSGNDFPKYIKRGQMFILNTSSYGPGVHWVAFYKSYNGKLYGYDSFNRDVRKLNKSWNKKNIISANIDRDQSYLDYSCGSRCVAWLICANKFTPEKIMNIV